MACGRSEGRSPLGLLDQDPLEVVTRAGRTRDLLRVRGTGRPATPVRRVARETCASPAQASASFSRRSCPRLLIVDDSTGMTGTEPHPHRRRRASCNADLGSSRDPGPAVDADPIGSCLVHGQRRRVKAHREPAAGTIERFERREIAASGTTEHLHGGQTRADLGRGLGDERTHQICVIRSSQG